MSFYSAKKYTDGYDSATAYSSIDMLLVTISVKTFYSAVKYSSSFKVTSGTYSDFTGPVLLFSNPNYYTAKQYQNSFKKGTIYTDYTNYLAFLNIRNWYPAIALKPTSKKFQITDDSIVLGYGLIDDKLSYTPNLRIVLGQIQTQTTFQQNRMYELPLESGWLEPKKMFIEDRSVYGYGYSTIPKKGVSVISGSTSFLVDNESFNNVFFYSLLGNPKPNKMSMYFVDKINAWKVTAAYIQNWRIQGGVNSLWKIDCDIIGTVYERYDRNMLPTFYVKSIPYNYHNSVLKITDISNSLNLSYKCTSITVSCNNGHKELTDNKGVVEPAFSNPTMSATIETRYDNNDFLNWQDSESQLYGQLYINDVLFLTLSKFTVTVELSDDDLTMQVVSLHLGKNGSDSNYVNSNIEDNRPMYFL